MAWQHFCKGEYIPPNHTQCCKSTYFNKKKKKQLKKSKPPPMRKGQSSAVWSLSLHSQVPNSYQPHFSAVPTFVLYVPIRNMELTTDFNSPNLLNIIIQQANPLQKLQTSHPLRRFPSLPTPQYSSLQVSFSLSLSPALNHLWIFYVFPTQVS